MKPKNVAISILSRRPCLSWEVGGARYHVWLKYDENPNSAEPCKPILPMQHNFNLYRNPLSRNSGKQFGTAVLNPDAKCNRPMVQEAMRIATEGDLHNKAISEDKAKQARKAEQNMTEDSNNLAFAIRDIKAELELSEGDPLREALSTLQVEGSIETRAAIYHAIRRQMGKSQ